MEGGPVRALEITFNNETLTLAQWATRLGLSRTGLWSRLQRWDVARALTEPPHPRAGRMYQAVRAYEARAEAAR
jgi:hypothetical protein